MISFNFVVHPLSLLNQECRNARSVTSFKETVKEFWSRCKAMAVQQGPGTMPTAPGNSWTESEAPMVAMAMF